MPSNIKTLVYGVSAAVAVSIVAGFFLVGTPKEERLRQFDAQRVNDLQSIQGQIVYYWQSKTVLPEHLEVLRDDIGGYAPPQDPETGTAYEYTVGGERTFTLCATFALASDEGNVSMPLTRPVPVKEPYGQIDTWQHDSGRVCFERTIDPELYPPLDKR